MQIILVPVALIVVSLNSISFNKEIKRQAKDVEYKKKIKIGFIGYGVVIIMCYIGQLLTSNVIDKYYNVISQNDLLYVLIALRVLFQLGGIQGLIFIMILCKSLLIKLCEEDVNNDSSRKN